MATQPSPSLTEQDYLAFDRAADYKSEFVDGEIMARAGGGLRHSRLASRLIFEFVRQLKSCTVYTSDARVRTPKSASYFYPAVSVVCGESLTHDRSDDILINPCLIAEVLSPSTADYDHGKKFARYREIPMLRDYLLIHSTEILVEHYARQADGNWLLSEGRGMDAAVELVSVECTLALASLYAGEFAAT